MAFEHCRGADRPAWDRYHQPCHIAETENNIRTNQAVTDTKLDELTREVREHNNFARRMPVVEEQIKVINHRIDDLEHEKGA